MGCLRHCAQQGDRQLGLSPLPSASLSPHGQHHSGLFPKLSQCLKKVTPSFTVNQRDAQDLLFRPLFSLSKNMVTKEGEMCPMSMARRPSFVSLHGGTQVLMKKILPSLT